MSNVPRAVVAQREEQSWALKAKGWSEREIADEIGLTRSGVNRILNRVTRRSLVKLNDQVAQEIVLQYDRLVEIYQESMAAWETSKRPGKDVVKQTVEVLGQVADDLELESAQRAIQQYIRSHVTERVGNPAFLVTAMKALADIRQLLKINSPDFVMQILQITNISAGSMQDYTAMTDYELRSALSK